MTNKDFHIVYQLSCQLLIMCSGESGPERARTEFLVPQNCHLAFRGYKFIQFLPELWSLAADSLISEVLNPGTVTDDP